jgi:hypothetical protein
VNHFLEQTLSGMVAALKDVGSIKDLELTVEGENVNLILNGAGITLNSMTSNMIATTILALVSVVQEENEINKLKIVINK